MGWFEKSKPEVNKKISREDNQKDKIDKDIFKDMLKDIEVRGTVGPKTKAYTKGIELMRQSIEGETGFMIGMIQDKKFAALQIAGMSHEDVADIIASIYRDIPEVEHIVQRKRIPDLLKMLDALGKKK